MTSEGLREELMRTAQAARAEPDEARELREKLIAERSDIDALIALLDKVLERTNGSAPAIAQSAPRRPSRRLALLEAMAATPDVWDVAAMRSAVIQAGLLADDERGTKQFYNVTNTLKKRGEIIHDGPSRYRISPLGIAAVRR